MCRWTGKCCKRKRGKRKKGEGGGGWRGGGRGRSSGSRRCGPAPSSLPWQTVSTSTDVALTVPNFTATPGPLTLPELQGFLAIIFNMGIIRLPELEDYWKTSWVTEVLFFSCMMPRNHFEPVFWVLHASHSTGPLKRIDKVRLFVEKILAKFQAKYTPTRELAVDETMLKFHGRFVGKQYMP